MAILRVRDAEGNVSEIPAIVGTPGYTPVRGTDYWTAEDQQAIVDAVLAALPSAEGVGY